LRAINALSHAAVDGTREISGVPASGDHLLGNGKQKGPAPWPAAEEGAGRGGRDRHRRGDYFG